MNVLEQSAAVTKQDDLTKPAEKGTTFEREIPAEGAALLRLQSYIETGTKQNKKNPSWKPAIDCIFTFELLHPKHMITPEGKPAFPQLYTMHVSKSATKGSMYIRLFNAMNWEAKHQHFDTMIGKTAFLGKLFHRVVGEGNDKKTYVNLMDTDKAWHIGAPRIIDPIAETAAEVPVPEMFGEGKLFLWEEAGWSDELIKAAWDTLYRETPEGATKSGNWIQETIREAVDWAGSRTESVVDGNDIDISALAAPTPEDTPPPIEKTTATSDADLLAGLGL